MIARVRLESARPRGWSVLVRSRPSSHVHSRMYVEEPAVPYLVVPLGNYRDAGCPIWSAGDCHVLCALGPLQLGGVVLARHTHRSAAPYHSIPAPNHVDSGLHGVASICFRSPKEERIPRSQSTWYSQCSAFFPPFFPLFWWLRLPMCTIQGHTGLSSQPDGIGQHISLVAGTPHLSHISVCWHYDHLSKFPSHHVRPLRVATHTDCPPPLQVFMTDTKTLTTEPITHAGGPILSLTKDAHRDLLWVSTPSSSLSAWPPPSGPPSHPVHAIDLQAHPDPDPTDAPHMPSPRAMPLRALSLPRERLPAASKAEPLVTLPGIPPLVRCAAFEDRRHVLTKDAAGCIALWDLVRGKPVKQYAADKVPPRPSLLPSRCFCACHLGSLSSRSHVSRPRRASFPAAYDQLACPAPAVSGVCVTQPVCSHLATVCGGRPGRCR